MRMRSWMQFYLRTAFTTSRNRVWLVPDSGLQIPDSGLQVPNSGFPVPASAFVIEH